MDKLIKILQERNYSELALAVKLVVSKMEFECLYKDIYKMKSALGSFIGTVNKFKLDIKKILPYIKTNGNLVNKFENELDSIARTVEIKPEYFDALTNIAEEMKDNFDALVDIASENLKGNEIKLLKLAARNIEKLIDDVLNNVSSIKKRTVRANTQVEALTANERKMVQGILQTIKALEKFKKGGLSLMIKAGEGGATTKVVSRLVDELLTHLESYEADRW